MSVNRFPAFSSALLALTVLALSAPTSRAADGDVNADPGSALVEAQCFDCHGNGAKEGNLALDELLAAEDSPAVRQQWRKVWKMVRQEFMPPAEAEPLARADRKAITRWVEHSALHIDFDHPDPGRVTMRRLNRMEYEATVSDLFGVDFTTAETRGSLSTAGETRLRDMLPPDDTAYGFDNIGDFQTLSPALLEKYFDIAELVVGKVIVMDGPWYPLKTLDRQDLETSRDREAKRTEHVIKFDVDEPGRYRVEVVFSIGGWQEYGGGFDFTFDFDGEQIAAELLDIGGHATRRFEREGELTAGEHKITLVTKAVKPDSEGQLVLLQLNPTVSLTGPISADRRSYPESHKRIFFDGEPPTDPAERRTYGSEILKRVASRAFRRSVDADTLERLTSLAMNEPSFERGIGNGLLAILTSPRFLFRTELQPQPDDPASRHDLDEYALASRLSFLLWLSLPDEELTKLAAAGKLRQNLPQQVARMMADPKSERFLEDFVGQWLRTRNVLMTPISRREDINPIRGAMKRETDMLFSHLVRNDRDLLELITANYTFANEELAQFYKIDGVSGDEFRRVELPPESRRGGILTQASFLISTSNPDRTSPVKRGLFVLDNLLATQPPAPPANVPALEDAKVEGKSLLTVRDQLEAHRADPACAACHAHFDPIGIVLENFDVAGQWRDADRSGAKIDAKSTTVTGEDLAGIDDLRNYIAANPERYYRCVTEKLLTYALGRGLEPFDAVTVDRITDELVASGGKFSTLLLEVVKSPAFQTRRGDDDSELDGAARAAIPEIPPPEKRRPEPRRRRGRRQQRAQAEQPAAQPPQPANPEAAAPAPEAAAPPTANSTPPPEAGPQPETPAPSAVEPAPQSNP